MNLKTISTPLIAILFPIALLCSTARAESLNEAAPAPARTESSQTYITDSLKKELCETNIEIVTEKEKPFLESRKPWLLPAFERPVADSLRKVSVSRDWIYKSVVLYESNPVAERHDISEQQWRDLVRLNADDAAFYYAIESAYFVATYLDMRSRRCAAYQDNPLLIQRMLDFVDTARPYVATTNNVLVRAARPERTGQQGVAVIFVDRSRVRDRTTYYRLDEIHRIFSRLALPIAP